MVFPFSSVKDTYSEASTAQSFIKGAQPSLFGRRMKGALQEEHWLGPEQESHIFMSFWLNPHLVHSPCRLLTTGLPSAPRVVKVLDFQ